MIRNIVFAGCSFTWGQSLHFFAYGDESHNIHPLDGNYYENKLLPHHYQYMKQTMVVQQNLFIERWGK